MPQPVEANDANEPHPQPKTGPEVQLEKLAEPSAARAGERIETLYSKLDPRLGIHLTDPNVVLTLADARGQTEFLVENPQDGDEAALAALNSKALAKEGIVFQAWPAPDGISVNVVSLAGIERATNETRLPGIPRFSAGEGQDGLLSWYQEATTSVKAAAEQGLYPAQALEEENNVHLVRGVIKGYPDVAIKAGILGTPSEGGDSVALNHTKIPYADYYSCAEPNYLYDPKDETAIAQHTAKWAQILEEYYQSPQHKSMRADAEFRQHRGLANDQL